MTLLTEESRESCIKLLSEHYRDKLLKSPSDLYEVVRDGRSGVEFFTDKELLAALIEEFCNIQIDYLKIN